MGTPRKRGPVVAAVVLALFVVVVVAAYVKSRGVYSADTGPHAAASGGTTVKLFHVEGMHCDGCVNAITDKVKKLDGVQSVEVSLEKHTARVVTEPGKPTAAEIAQVIKDLGYQPEPFDGSAAATTHPASH